MKTIISTLIISFLSFTALAGAGPHMTVLGEFTTRPGNLTAAEDDTIYFSNSPLGNPQFKVMKLVDGKGVPYPNAAMSKNFAAVIGIRIEKNGTLWFLDMGNAETSPRLIGWDTIKAQLKTIIYLPKEVYVENSFLQGMAVDERHRRIYIADMTLSGAIDPSTPGIVVVNLDTGEARRVLHNRPFLQSEEGVCSGPVP